MDNKSITELAAEFRANPPEFLAAYAGKLEDLMIARVLNRAGFFCRSISPETATHAAGINRWTSKWVRKLIDSRNDPVLCAELAAAR